MLYHTLLSLLPASCYGGQKLSQDFSSGGLQLHRIVGTPMLSMHDLTKCYTSYASTTLLLSFYRLPQWQKHLSKMQKSLKSRILVSQIFFLDRELSQQVKNKMFVTILLMIFNYYSLKSWILHHLELQLLNEIYKCFGLHSTMIFCAETPSGITRAQVLPSQQLQLN